MEAADDDFRVVPALDLSAAVSVIEQTTGRESMDQPVPRYETFAVCPTTLRTYADALLHFLRWWETVHHTD